MGRQVRKMMGLVCVLALTSGLALAQDVFLSPKGTTTGSDASSPPAGTVPDSPLFPSVRSPVAPPDGTQTADEAAGATAPSVPGNVPGTLSDTVPTLSNGQPAAVYPDINTVRALVSSNRTIDPAAVRDITNFKPPQTPADFAVLQGMNPAEFNRQRDMFEKAVGNDPVLMAHSPFAMVDMMTDSQRYQQALSDRIKISCNLPTLAVTLDMAGFMQDPRTRVNINKKIIQPFGTAVDGLCRDARQREKISANFYGLLIQHEKGAAPSLTHDDGLFKVKADFSTEEPVPAALLSTGMANGVKEVEDARERAARNAPAVPATPSTP